MFFALSKMKFILSLVKTGGTRGVGTSRILRRPLANQPSVHTILETAAMSDLGPMNEERRMPARGHGMEGKITSFLISKDVLVEALYGVFKSLFCKRKDAVLQGVRLGYAVSILKNI